MAHFGFRIPDPLSFEGNVAENWRRFKQEYDILVEATYSANSKKSKAAILLNHAGPDAIERARSFTYTDGETKDDPDVLARKFEELCKPYRNVTMERHKFNTRRQGQSESFGTYLSDLRNKASTCEYGVLKDEMIRDNIVCGINSDKIRALLLRESDLTLKKAIDLCSIAEQSSERIKELAQTQSATEVHGVYKKHPKSSNSYSNPVKYSDKQQCGKCGNRHKRFPREGCPAHGQVCRKCGKDNHYAKVCKSETNKQTSKPTYSKSHSHRRVHQIDDRYEYDSDDSYDDGQPFVIGSLNSIDAITQKQEEIYDTVVINGKSIQLKIDTGAQCNVLPLQTFKTIRRHERIKESRKSRLVDYGGNTIETLGTVTFQCQHNNNQESLTFHIIKLDAKPIIGLHDSRRLSMIKICVDSVSEPITHNALLSEYAELFTNELGTLPVQYKIKLKENVSGVIKPPRRVPLAMEEKVKMKLDDMVATGVLAPVDRPTEWVSSMVAVRKRNKDDIRICIDPKDLNEAICREHYPARTIETIIKKINKSEYFTVIDASNAYWQIELEEESSYYTTFNTPHGRFRFTRMPFGICSAAEVFQKAMDHLFEGTPCQIMADDLLVWGETEEIHDRNLRAVLERARKVNLKLKTEKCKFKQQEVSYVGHILTKEGVKPDPAKVKDITEMAPPEDVKALSRFLGMVNYVGKFIPKLSEMATKLRELNKQDVLWSWNAENQKAYDAIKEAIAHAPTLKYYNPKQPITLTCDASKAGMGAACLQNGEPIAYASKAMTETQRNYAQIEKELLAVTFACEKFDDYIYGRRVTIETDHKPLETICKKSILAAPARLQKMLLKLQRYDINVVYKRGSELYIADTLSRSFQPETCPNLGNDEYEVMLVDSVLITSTAQQTLRDATNTDPEMRELKTHIAKGWPNYARDLRPSMKPYYNYRDELCIVDDIILKGDKVVVPISLRDNYMQQVHRGHIGIDAARRRAKDAMFWPSMNNDLTDYVSRCDTCASNRQHQQKEPMVLHNIPKRPWSIVATDLFLWDNTTYLVTVDSYSGWFEIEGLQKTTSNAIIQRLKQHFARYGIPDVLLSDNGPQYSSAEFSEFAKQWNFTHKTSSPNYAQSNGLAENAVKSAKHLLEKTKCTHDDPILALLSMSGMYPVTDVTTCYVAKNQQRCQQVQSC